ncbi:MAG: hypothetical protein AAGH64_06375 [Planctomycetota bacterium]
MPTTASLRYDLPPSAALAPVASRECGEDRGTGEVVYFAVDREDRA